MHPVGVLNGGKNEAEAALEERSIPEKGQVGLFPVPTSKVAMLTQDSLVSKCSRSGLRCG